MSELKTNKISTNDQNNVAIDNALGLKSYTTTQRNALTSVAGDTIYNTTDSKIQFYNGSAWADTGTDVLTVDYLVIAGGGSGGAGYQSGSDRRGGGGGAGGGYRNSYSTENSGGPTTNEAGLYPDIATNYTVTIGAGGVNKATGSPSDFSVIKALGGGGGANMVDTTSGSSGGSGGGGGCPGTSNGGSAISTNIVLHGYGGGGGDSTVHPASHGAAGGGGAGAIGSNSSGTSGGAGGAGRASSITGSSITRSAGGAGGNSGSSGSGGAGSSNTGDGGAGTHSAGSFHNGGSGVVILRYPKTFTITNPGGGLTTAGEVTTGDDKYIIYTAGTGNVQWN